MAYRFEINWDELDVDNDKFHNFSTLGDMRKFINLNNLSRFEVTVYKDGEQVITLPAGIYFETGQHPTLQRMCGKH